MSIKKIRTLHISFDAPISPYQVSAFRGAIIEKAGRENILFHNHIDDDKFVYKYPLIQYKVVRKQPSIFCLDAGVDEIHHLFQKKSWNINLSGNPVELKVDRLDLKTVTLNVWDKSFDYTIINWQALNEKNYPAYIKMVSFEEKAQLLQRVLTGNILSFAKGLDWHIDQPIKIQIHEIRNEQLRKMKGIHVGALDVAFSCNVFLPNFIGLGKGVSMGFGIVKQVKNIDE